MSDKIPLILLPGLLCDDALWAAQVDGLTDIADVTVADLTTADSMATLAANVLAAAPERFAVAGLSMGGYVAQEIVRQAPERVSHLALLDTNARADTAEQTENRKRMIAVAEAGKFDAVAPDMLPNLVHADHVDDPKMGGAFLDMATRIGKDAYIRQQTAIMGRIDGRPHLPAIDCPTLVLCGEQDALTPPKVHEEMVEAIGANAAYVVVPHCGHLSTLERPDAVNAAMRAWLSH